MNKPTVYLICGVHNNLKYTQKLLTSIRNQDYPHLKIIIVDDGSTDNTALFIQKEYPDVILLPGDGNLWWTGAIHLGVIEALKTAKLADFILTINNDCEFGKYLVTSLVNVSLKNNRGIVGSLIVDYKDRSSILDAGVGIDWGKGKFISLGPKTIKDLSKKHFTEELIDTLSTKGTLYPMEVFQKIGNFDIKHLPHYISDFEFACRAKRAGFNLIISYDSIIYNDAERTGFGGSIATRIGLQEYFRLLFSRNSRINIIDHYWFITLCCPDEFKLVNYFRILIKSIFLLSLVFPFILFRPLILKFKTPNREVGYA